MLGMFAKTILISSFGVLPFWSSILLFLFRHTIPVRTDLRFRLKIESDFFGEVPFWVPDKDDMANNSFRGSKYVQRGEASREAEFSCSLLELRSLMELRGVEAITRIQESYGDVNGLCLKLRTSSVEGKSIKTDFILTYCTRGQIWWGENGWGPTIQLAFFEPLKITLNGILTALYTLRRIGQQRNRSISDGCGPRCRRSPGLSTFI